MMSSQQPILFVKHAPDLLHSDFHRKVNNMEGYQSNRRQLLITREFDWSTFVPALDIATQEH